MSFAKQVDHTINTILIRAENQHELLLGQCQSEQDLTNTQEHILMLLEEEKHTNKELAEVLQVSQAAITKACKQLVTLNLLETVRDVKDARVTYYQLSQAGQPIAQEHASHHAATQARYQAISQKFTADEQKIIQRFLSELERTLEQS